MPLSNFFTGPWNSRFASDSTHSNLELVSWQNSCLINSGRSTVTVWPLGFRQVQVSIKCLLDLVENWRTGKTDELINCIGNERVKNGNLIAQLKSQFELVVSWEKMPFSTVAQSYFILNFNWHVPECNLLLRILTVQRCLWVSVSLWGWFLCFKFRSSLISLLIPASLFTQ